MKNLRALLLPCAGLLLAGTLAAGETGPDPLTSVERAWLAEHPKIVLGVGEEWAPAVIKDVNTLGDLPLFQLLRSGGTTLIWNQIKSSGDSGMIEIQLAVPEELTLVLQAEQASLAAEASMAAAVKLYELGRRRDPDTPSSNRPRPVAWPDYPC